MKTCALASLLCAASAFNVPAPPAVKLGGPGGPPVSAACMAGEQPLFGDATVQAATHVLNDAIQSQTAAAGQACGAEIVANKTVGVPPEFALPTAVMM